MNVAVLMYTFEMNEYRVYIPEFHQVVSCLTLLW